MLGLCFSFLEPVVISSLSGTGLDVLPVTTSPVTPSADPASVPCGSSAPVSVGGETPVASGSKLDVVSAKLVADSSCGGEIVSPTVEKDDDFGTVTSRAGILGQTSSSPQLTPLLTGFGKAFPGLTPSDSRKRGRVDIFCLFLSFYLVGCLVIHVDGTVASAAAERTGTGSSGKKKRQLRVQTANLQLAQLTVSGNENFFVREN